MRKGCVVSRRVAALLMADSASRVPARDAALSFPRRSPPPSPPSLPPPLSLSLSLSLSLLMKYGKKERRDL